MIVLEKEARRIYSERKVEHRIPARRVAPARQSVCNIQYRTPNPGLGYLDGEPLLETITLCRCTIVDVVPSELAMADVSCAQREGCKTVDELVALYEERNGKPRKYEPVWVLTLSLNREAKRRFLSQRVVAGVTSDYVTNPARALRHEAEAIDEFTLDRYAKAGRLRHAAFQAARGSAMAMMEFESQFVELLHEAKRKMVDVRDPARQIRRYPDRPDVVEHQLKLIRTRLGLEAA